MPLRLFLLLLCVTFGACAGRRAAFETGSAECSDGQDNDEDGKIDCADEDCHYLAFCGSPTDGGRDHGPSDGPSPKDHRPPDLKLPKPDLPASQYGRRCSFSGTVASCSDKQTFCVPGKYSTPGLCTYPCESDSCPPGPQGSYSHCGYLVNGQWFCIFLCSQNPCPHDTECFQSPTGGFFCF